MSHPAPSLDRERLVTTMVAVLDRAETALAPFEWRLVGTGAALLHGVDLLTEDVDILVRERAAVDAFAKAMAPFASLQAPAWLEGTRQYYATCDVKGVQLQLSTVEVESDRDTIETFGRGPWQHFVLLPCGPYSVPAVALELRLITELRRQRPDRYRPIVEFMRVSGCDLPFVRRGVTAAGLPPETQAEVLAALADAPFRAAQAPG